ncbi:hypothetical protein ACFU8W_02525 [Streptomyces sp. NPDC057565]|uniref:hypothetical protein n=1 Tax=Streptomyces sp. NPDC057565 TaxID=3346169 RepID=UPI0036914E2E
MLPRQHPTPDCRAAGTVIPVDDMAINHLPVLISGSWPRPFRQGHEGVVPTDAIRRFTRVGDRVARWIVG